MSKIKVDAAGTTHDGTDLYCPPEKPEVPIRKPNTSMTDLKFEAFEKMPRMKRECTITEKVDGTNAQILFDEEGNLLVGSRKREIWPEGTEGKPKGCDNIGFAQWVYANRGSLFAFLGQGRHFGEWCGGKIQRGYQMKDKKFLLFNTGRFGPGRQEVPEELKELGLGAVPVLHIGLFTTDTVDKAMVDLKASGSRVSEGFMNPEGVVVYHHALRTSFKITYEHDYKGKGPDLQSPA